MCVKIVLIANALGQMWYGVHSKLSVTFTQTDNVTVTAAIQHSNITMTPGNNYNAYDFETPIGIYFRTFDAMLQIVIAGVQGTLFALRGKLQRKIDSLEEEIYVDIVSLSHCHCRISRCNCKPVSK